MSGMHLQYVLVHPTSILDIIAQFRSSFFYFLDYSFCSGFLCIPTLLMALLCVMVAFDFVSISTLITATETEMGNTSSTLKQSRQHNQQPVRRTSNGSSGSDGSLSGHRYEYAQVTLQPKTTTAVGTANSAIGSRRQQEEPPDSMRLPTDKHQHKRQFSSLLRSKPKTLKSVSPPTSQQPTISESSGLPSRQQPLSLPSSASQPSKADSSHAAPAAEPEGISIPSPSSPSLPNLSLPSPTSSSTSVDEKTPKRSSTSSHSPVTQVSSPKRKSGWWSTWKDKYRSKWRNKGKDVAPTADESIEEDTVESLPNGIEVREEVEVRRIDMEELAVKDDAANPMSDKGKSPLFESVKNEEIAVVLDPVVAIESSSSDIGTYINELGLLTEI
jgi:hypothetical protein